eukprot:6087516-Prorocentrum_lima.AAC.1
MEELIQPPRRIWSSIETCTKEVDGKEQEVKQTCIKNVSNPVRAPLPAELLGLPILDNIRRAMPSSGPSW